MNQVQKKSISVFDGVSNYEGNEDIQSQDKSPDKKQAP